MQAIDRDVCDPIDYQMTDVEPGLSYSGTPCILKYPMQVDLQNYDAWKQ